MIAEKQFRYTIAREAGEGVLPFKVEIFNPSGHRVGRNFTSTVLGARRWAKKRVKAIRRGGLFHEEGRL